MARRVFVHRKQGAAGVAVNDDGGCGRTWDRRQMGVAAGVGVRRVAGVSMRVSRMMAVMMVTRFGRSSRRSGEQSQEKAGHSYAGRETALNATLEHYALVPNLNSGERGRFDFVPEQGIETNPRRTRL